MAVVKLIANFSIVLIAVLTLGCGGPGKNSTNSPSGANQASDSSNSAKTNVEELRLVATVPYEAEDVAWKENKANKKLIAVLRFSPTDSAKIVAEAERVKPPEAASVSSESWFPPELIAQSEMSGDDVLKGNAYAANQFFLDQYSSGRVIRIENTDYFVLELSAK
ncbi:MAG: hypothetical protein WBC19_07290 [Pyrinomonadaceae bacterium]|nr:hypothetical protein [Chloracidobacterium sp.]MBP7415773.1 hypothetical protein [Pyrinomonadaceae bacterium]